MRWPAARILLIAITALLWTLFPNGFAKLATGDRPEVGPFEGPVARIGHPNTAPLLRVCIAPEEAADGFYQVLRAGRRQSNLEPLFGKKPEPRQIVLQIESWLVLSECIFQKENRKLCDRDNRALAIEVASTVVRMNAEAADRDPAAAISLKESTDRVLEYLRRLTRDGILIAADFGIWAPAPIKDLVGRTKSEGDGCAPPTIRSREGSPA